VRFNRENTPPTLRRTKKGSVVARFQGQHTAESLAAEAVLAERWQVSKTEAIRRALIAASAQSNPPRDEELYPHAHDD